MRCFLRERSRGLLPRVLHDDILAAAAGLISFCIMGFPLLLIYCLSSRQEHFNFMVSC